MELVIAWNQPILRLGEKYVFGVSATKGYLLMAPWSAEVIDEMRPKLEEFKVNKKTIQIPSDWEVDTKLLPCMSSNSGFPSVSASGSDRVTFPCRFATSILPSTAMYK